MPLTAQSLREIATLLDRKQRVVSSVALNHRFGILPHAEFRCRGAFVKNVLEIRPLKCMALLPSGRIIDTNEDVSVKIPLLYGEKYYLTVAFDAEEVSYEKGDVPLVRPRYQYEIHTMEEMEQGDCLPIMKFVVTDGRFNIDATFLPPHFLLDGDERFAAHIDSIAEKLSLLTAHANLEDGEGKRCLLRYLFQLRSYDRKETTANFMQFVQEVAHAIDYYVMRPNMTDTPAIATCSHYDVGEWLAWFGGYMDAAKSVLDKVVLEDRTIDYEKLKQEIQADVYQRVYDLIYGQVKSDILDKFNPEMEKQIRETLTVYLNDVLGKQLHDTLQTELSASLREGLYQPLYNALYDALYVPVVEEEREEYIPQI